MQIFISSMVHQGWHNIADLIAGQFVKSVYKPDPVPENDTKWIELGRAVELAAEAGFLTADQIVVLAGSDARLDAEFEEKT